MWPRGRTSRPAVQVQKSTARSLCFGLAAVPIAPRSGTALCQRDGPRRKLRHLTTATSAGQEADAQTKRQCHWLGRKHREDTKQKISIANKGNTPWNKGRKHSDETRRKIAERTRAAMLRPEMREKMRKRNTGRKHDVETKEKIKRQLHETNTLKALQSGPKRNKRGKMQLPLIVSRLSSGKLPFVYEAAMKEKVNDYINVRLQDKKFVAKLKVLYDGATQPPKGRGRAKRSISEESRQKLSAKIRQMWEDPAYRERVVGGMRSKFREQGRRPLSPQHRERIRLSLLQYNSGRYGKAKEELSAEQIQQLEDRRQRLEEKRRERQEARNRMKAERKRKHEENRKKEVMRSELDKSLVEVLRSAGALPEPEKPGIIDASKMKLSALDDMELPAMHLDFDTEGDHVTTVDTGRRKRRSKGANEDLNLDGVSDAELGGGDDDDDFDEDDDDDLFDELDDELATADEQKRARRTAQNNARSRRSSSSQEVKTNVLVYVDGKAFEVDEQTGERTPALNTLT